MSNRVPFDGIDVADGFVASRVVYYAQLYSQLREVGYQLGWALTLHGSLQKDLDIVAVPWVEDAASEAELVEALVERAGGFLVVGATQRPHGRQTWTIHLGRTGGYVDLSVDVPAGR